MRGYWLGQPCLFRVICQYFSNASISIRFLTDRLKKINGPFFGHRIGMNCQDFLKNRWKRNYSVFFSFALMDADLTSFEIYIAEFDLNKLTNTNACLY